MASANKFNFPYFFSQPQPHFQPPLNSNPPPPAPRNPISPPPPRNRPWPPPRNPIAPPPPPRIPTAPPPPAPRNPIAPPPPRISPRPPPLPPSPSPNNNNTVIVVVFVSLGGLFLLAFLAVSLCCFIKKRKKKVQETDVIHVEEHRTVKEAIVPGPCGPQAVILSVEDDIHVDEEIRKNDIRFGGKGLHEKHINEDENPTTFKPVTPYFSVPNDPHSS